MSVDKARGRITLSLKQMQPDPLQQNLDNVLQPTDSDSEARARPCRVSAPLCECLLVRSGVHSGGAARAKRGAL